MKTEKVRIPAKQIARRCLVGLSVFCYLGLVHLSTAANLVAAEIDASLTTILNFETDQNGTMPSGWKGGPVKTITLDANITHGGRWAVCIDRTSESPGAFSSLTKSIPLDVTGTRIQLRGFIRTEAVSEFAGLWMREDGDDAGLEFENMQSRKLNGSTDWAEYSISLPLNAKARTLAFGFLLGGTGRAWVDDLQLTIDGQPIWQAPKSNRIETIFDRDHEFDRGSRIAVSELNSTQVANLVTLGQVWGYLKYHHPKVTGGHIHWDYELFRILPPVLKAMNQADANHVLLDWIDGLGELHANVQSNLNETELHLRPELSWIDPSRLGVEMSSRLRAVHAGRGSAGQQFYVSLAPGVGNPVFEHEPAYSGIQGADPGYQLLGLFRFWNIIRYWFPYRDLIDDNWDAVLADFIPRIALAKTPEADQLQMLAMIAKVHDSHANLWSSLGVRPPVGESQLPVNLRFVAGRAVVVSIDSDRPVGLQRGDVIDSIDGVSVEKLIASWTPFYAASNEAKRHYDIARHMMRGPAGAVKLQIERNGGKIELESTRVLISSLSKNNRDPHDLPGPAFRLLSKDVAYLKLSDVKAGDAASYVHRAAGTKGWIIDIRNYPKEFVVFALGSHFVDRPTSFARFTIASLANPGAFSFQGIADLRPAPRKSMEKSEIGAMTEFERAAANLSASRIPSGEPVVGQRTYKSEYTGKLVILVDESSISQAEYTAMAFRSVPNAIVVGSMTAGADGNVSRIPLPGGLHTMISGIGIFYPDKRPTQRVGIIPDVEIRPTVEGIRLGRDEVLEQALQQILGPNVSSSEIENLAKPVAD